MQIRRLTNSTWEITTHSLIETDEAAGRLSRIWRAPAVVLLEGTLGSGKTTLVQALLRHLGVRSTVKSPTYDLVHIYPLADGTKVYHADLYRIASVDELDFLDLPAPDNRTALVLAEWGSCLGDRYPNHFFTQLDILSTGSRKMTITAVGSGAQERMGAWEEGRVL